MKKKKKRTAGDVEAAVDLDVKDILPEPAEGDDELKISEKFAKKYNERKDRQELARSKQILEEEGGSSSDSEPSDDGAELLTPKVESKIFETLSKIKSRDPSIYDEKHVFFGDDDFKEASIASKSSGSKEKKGVKYKDFLRDTLIRDGADALVREEEALERRAKRKTPNEEQADLKKDILAAAHGESGDDSDDLFTIKEKTEEERRKEDEEFESFLESKVGRREADGEEIMSRYWKADEDLDDNEQFLRDFVLNKGWMETDSIQATSSRARLLGGEQEDEMDSSDEEEHLEKTDEYERDYNFRFEVEEGKQIQGHARFPEASVREKNDKRKRARHEKAERQQQEKIRRTEELKRLKNLKKQEIARRLKQIQEVTGNQESALGSIDLDKDFDPDTHDQDMGRLLGDNYDEEDEVLPEAELTQAPAGLEAELDVSAAGATVPAAAGASARRLHDDVSATTGADDAEWDDPRADVEDEDVDDQTWWLCDMCQKGIPAGKRRFDCAVCENFTLCMKCFRVRKHPHKFVRRRVPDKAMPPDDYRGREADDQGIQEALDEYFQLDYEDIIGGDLPTRFKYRKVEANAYGMTPQDILNKSDQELNRVVSLKKLRTYRGDPGAIDGQAVGRSADGRGRGRGAGRGGGGRGWHKAVGGKSAKEKSSGMDSQRFRAYNLQADHGVSRKKKAGKKDT